MHRYFLLLGGVICAGAPVLFASGIDATATYTDSLVSPGVFQYDLTLNNTGTTTIGTFWFSWVPGDNFMAVSPTDITLPSGWQEVVTSGGPSDGFAIQWTAKAPGNDLASGGSLTGFDFDSTLTPAELAGFASGEPSIPITTAFSYSGEPFSDGGVQFVATPAAIASTPEPTTTLSMALGFGLILLLSSAARRRKLSPEIRSRFSD
jgi:hypothetical protein